MEYELITTLNGPLIKRGAQYITVQEPHLLIELAEADPNFIPAVKKHITENLRSSIEDLCEAFEDGMSHMSPSLNAYMNSAFMFNNFINGPWANYQRAKAEGGFK
jgi:hypothetical protein